MSGELIYCDKKDEIDILKSELQARNRESAEFKADNTALNDMVKFRTNELDKLRVD
jgi:hypothetical protein